MVLLDREEEGRAALLVAGLVHQAGPRALEEGVDQRVLPQLDGEEEGRVGAMLREGFDLCVVFGWFGGAVDGWRRLEGGLGLCGGGGWMKAVRGRVKFVVGGLGGGGERRLTAHVDRLSRRTRNTCICMWEWHFGGSSHLEVGALVEEEEGRLRLCVLDGEQQRRHAHAGLGLCV